MGLQGVTGVDKGLQRDTGGDMGLEGVTTKPGKRVHV